MDSSGRPIVSWIASTSDGGYDDFVARWNGTQWDSLGEVGLKNVKRADLELDDQLDPIIGWTDGTGDGGISSWNGAAWSPSPPLTGVSDPFVGFDSTLGALIVARVADLKAYHVASNAWQAAIVPPIPVGALAEHFHFSVAPNHEAVVAWVDYTGPVEIGFSRWNGTTWSTHAGLFYSGADAVREAPEVAVDSQGTTWLEWRDDSQMNVWMSNY